MSDEPHPLSADMFKLVMEELRAIRKRLDDHIDDEKTSITQVQKDITKIREEMAGHKTKLATISASIALVIGSVVSWFLGVVGK